MRIRDTRFLTSVAGIALAGILIVAVFIALAGVSGRQSDRNLEIHWRRFARLRCSAMRWRALSARSQYLLTDTG